MSASVSFVDEEEGGDGDGFIMDNTMFDLDDRPTLAIEECNIDAIDDALASINDIATISDSAYVSLSRHGEILSAGRILKSDRFPGCEKLKKRGGGGDNEQPMIDGKDRQKLYMSEISFFI